MLVDITYAKFIGRDRMIEICPASGGDWGSCNIDNKIRKLLEKIFTVEFMKFLRDGAPKTHLKIKQQVQNVKLKIDRDHVLGSSMLQFLIGGRCLGTISR